MAHGGGSIQFKDPLSGAQLPGSPVSIPDNEMIQFLKCVDVDGDGLDEIFVNAQTRCCMIEWVGVTTAVEPSRHADGSLLSQNHPNPFNPVTTIEYTVPTDAPVTLTIYDVAGRRVRVLQDGHQAPGDYTVQWDGRNSAGVDVASGSYYYQLVVDGQAESRKMIVLK